MTRRPTVLVLDGEQRAALAVVRSLGRQGCLVHVGATGARSMAGGSRYTASETALPDPLAGTEDYCRAVASLLTRYPSQVLLPVTEAATLALLERRELFPDVGIPTSDLTRFRRAADKQAVLALAESQGIAVPAQWTVSSDLSDLPSIGAERFPLVLKPSRSVIGDEGSRRKVGVRYAQNLDQLVQILNEYGPGAGPFLLQSRIEGPGVGVFLLRWNGKILARFAHRRIREKPPSGGVSVCCESVSLPADLLTQSVGLLESLDWNGVAMVEYKRHLGDGRNYLMEINPRFWGSLQLAIDAGVDFPWYLVQAALGESVAAPASWPLGLRSRWCWGEIDHLIARLRRSRAALDLPPETPGLLATAFNVLLPWRPGQRSDVFRLSDPVPGWRESVAWVRAL